MIEIDPYLEAVVQRRLAGEGSVYAYTCSNGCGWHQEKELTCANTDCGSPLRAYRGYWGTSTEYPDDPNGWFYPLDLVREVAGQ